MQDLSVEAAPANERAVYELRQERVRKIYYRIERKAGRQCRQSVAGKVANVLPRAILSNRLVVEVAEQHSVVGRTLRQIAERFGINYSTLSETLKRVRKILEPGVARLTADYRQSAVRHADEKFIEDITQLKDANGFLADQNLLAVGVKADRYNKPKVDKGNDESERKAARFFEAIIGLHILADAASASIRVPRSSTQESSVFDALANVLLTLRGSLSTVSKFHGIVLPKMRTPQSGLTLRNLSHNLTFHDCEVEVMWRSFPWANFDEHTLNVLYVPYPFDFNPKRFKVETNHYESVGYFTYDPGEWKGAGKSVVRLIENVRDKGIRPHMLVFTETAFCETTYEKLLKTISDEYGSNGPRHIPIVVAGVAKKDGDLSYNELRLATHFAGKWYELTQHKHHRWQLNNSQIRQYGLQGHLSTARPLFEKTVIDQRRLTFFAPTPWLVMSPLICEDLSRIEPISELIRGVGPTLVLALLLDGPQLADRWPGRYASVLADDPGTGVLTVTSFGAAEASKPLTPPCTDKVKSEVNQQSQQDKKVVVASWKDPSSSFRTLPASKNEALLLTLTANMGEEFTLDRRGISNKAAGFRLDGSKTFEIEVSDEQSDQETKTERNNAPADLDKLGTWADIREVTALTYVASAALSLLRPHQSRHPEQAKELTDKWDVMRNWGNRCRHVRQLMDIMLGQPVITDEIYDDKYEENRKQLKEIKRQRADDSPNFEYFRELEMSRHLSLDHIFRTGEELKIDEGRKLAPNRHFFAVLCFAQTTIDVEVRNEDVKWPTKTLKFACIALRILLDSIAGFDYRHKIVRSFRKVQEDREMNEKLKAEYEKYEAEDKKFSEIYCSRLRIAGQANASINPNIGGRDNLDPQEPRDVEHAPEPLLFYDREKHPDKENGAILYRGQFKNYSDLERKDPKDLEDYPNRYDFYRMTLELVDAIVKDEEASLWKRCQNEFKECLNEDEMRRLTLLVLMMLPALIHEQLEFEYIRPRSSEKSMSSHVMHNLIEKSERILKDATEKTRIKWNR